MSVEAVLADGSVVHGLEDLDEAILRLVAAHRGSIAAEHGVGVAKAKGCR